jgi:hypothetical protein
MPEHQIGGVVEQPSLAKVARQIVASYILCSLLIFLYLKLHLGTSFTANWALATYKGTGLFQL